MNPDLSQAVWRRAGGRCEYCRLPARVYPLPFHVDHIIARKHGGPTVLENLALACLHCNRHKGPNIAGTDPHTGDVIRLYHPRLDSWEQHLEWSGAALRGLTAIGRATVEVLAINEADFLIMRGFLMHEQIFPRD